MRRRWLTIRGKLAAKTDMTLGPCESVQFREDVYVLENPRPTPNRVCTLNHSSDVTHTVRDAHGYSMLKEISGIQQVDSTSIKFSMILASTK